MADIKDICAINMYNNLKNLYKQSIDNLMLLLVFEIVITIVFAIVFTVLGELIDETIGLTLNTMLAICVIEIILYLKLLKVISELSEKESTGKIDNVVSILLHLS